MIFQYLNHEFTFDRHNQNHKRIYRVLVEKKGYGKEAMTPFNLAQDILMSVPEVKNAARVYEFQASSAKIHSEYVPVDYFQCVDYELLSILSLHLIAGNLENFKKDQRSILLSESFAKKYFQNNISIGESLIIEKGGEKYELSIQGIFKDIPDNSTFRADIIGNIYLRFPKSLESSKLGVCHTYILLHDNTDYHEVSNKLEKLGKEIAGLTDTERYIIQSLKDIYLNSNDVFEVYNIPIGNKNTLFILAGVSILLIGITLFNYLLISSGIAISRANETRIRRIHGANKTDIFLQTNFEMFITITISFVISLIFIPIISKGFVQTFSFPFELNVWASWYVIAGIFCFIILLSVLASLYTTKSLWESHTLKERYGIEKVHTKGSFKSALVLIQLIIFTGILLSTLLLRKQINYIINKDIGYNYKNNIILTCSSRLLFPRFKVIKEQLSIHPEIYSVSGTSSYGPPATWDFVPYSIEKLDEDKVEIRSEVLRVDYNFLETLEMEMKDGRFFDEKYPTDSNSIIINESLADMLIFDNLVGKHLDDRQIIGVIKNFHLHSLHSDIGPIVLVPVKNSEIGKVYINIKNEEHLIAMEIISDIFTSIVPDESFQMNLLEDKIIELYGKETRLFRLFTGFSLLSIILSSLGLFGMTNLILKYKTKEFAIRKVQGASVINLITFHLNPLIKMLVLAMLISAPFSVILFKKWLTNFSFKISIGLLPFALTILIGLIIILLSTGFQSFCLSKKNPIESLRNE